ncbi:Sodium/hydrogen exchanger family-domain-containing protein [Panaeolus papilionaceus]|nr:Sodium/hydrogen exchanger family-domain-containing protein [Panaeolus papilionaceus]
MARSPEGTPSQVPYSPPHIEQLLTISAFLYLLPLSSALFDDILNAGLLGPLFLGIIFGAEVGNILPNAIQTAFISVGYVGLILLIFEGGLTTNISLFIRNLGLSTLVGFTGVGLPIAFSIILLHLAFDKSVLQSFGAGAALCSTSLGTTLALMSPQMRTTRVGSVLMSAALLDDIIGLVMAAIIVELASHPASTVPPAAIVRPIFVSLAFGLFTPAVAISTRYVLRRFVSGRSWAHHLLAPRIQLLFIILSLSGFVTAAKFSGTSELFGAYLAGTFLCYVFEDLPASNVTDIEYSPHITRQDATGPAKRSGAVEMDIRKANRSTSPSGNAPTDVKTHDLHPTHTSFTTYIAPFLNGFLSPLFFASVDSALLIRSLFSSSTSGVDIGARVVWRGIVYSVFMMLTKVAAGLWILVWPSAKVGGITNQADTLPSSSNGTATPPTTQPEPRHSQLGHGRTTARDLPSSTLSRRPFRPQEPKRSQSALFLGLALVARGEIALIVAQLGKPLITGPQGDDEEAFAIVLWAVLLSTIGGALSVGVLLKSRWWNDGWKSA